VADDFSRGAQRGFFPTTRRSAVVAAGSDDPAERARAFERLVRAYWKPVYKQLRVRWRLSDEQAADLTQGFFARALEQRMFAAYDPARALFRTYLKACLDRHVLKDAESRQRQKRGGGVVTLSLDFPAAERELEGLAPPSAETIESYFDREWTRHLVGMTVDALRERCEQSGKQLTFRVFERYVLEDDSADRPSYAQLASELAIKVSDVTNYLAFARREFRRLLLEQLRELTGSEEELAAEARALVGGAP
jgi:DNA-directed RNA polymerase specialized sigma24 family protein